MTKATSYTDEVIDDGAPWYAVKLSRLKLEEVRTYFTNHNLEMFSFQNNMLTLRDETVNHTLFFALLFVILSS